jgi:outer membrane protein OmpA-like peptidoglycan-associated protein/tetratricopeptide (TPR) repeat protein
MIVKNYITILLIWLTSLTFGQNHPLGDKKVVKLFEQALLAYKENQYGKSLRLLNEVLAADSSFYQAFLLQTDIYQELDSVKPQIRIIEKAIKIDPDKSPKLYYLLGNAYYRSGFYQKASNAFQSYLDRVNDKSPFAVRSQQYLEKCYGAAKLLNHPVPFKSINLGPDINSEDDEYWPSITVDGKTIIFTRLVGSGIPPNQRKVLVQEDFYTAHFDDNHWLPCEPLSSINTIYNEGAQSISTDGKLLFFTACTRNDGSGSCDIYFSRNKSGVWSVAQNAGAPVNSPSWESQPSISANGETLYFVSNRKGGRGGMDIWKCNLKGFSEPGYPIWGNPVNLGDSVNTPGNEISPFIHADGKTLYFASDYWPGLGGYDIFYSRLKNDSVWTNPRNIGYPINSYKDEQGLVVDASGKNAYYSSDRPGSKGMDIYSFNLYREARPTPVSYIKGKVVDAESGNPLCSNVELVDLDKSTSVIKGESCWEKGEFLMCLPLGKEYAFNISKEGYLFYSANFKLKEVTDIIDPYILEIKLKKIKIGGSVVLRNVFFNTGSFELLPESKTELQKLIDFLNQNRSLSIEIGGHTDNIGSSEMNQNLSESRAREVYKYLIAHGISENRMKYAGYGLSQPVSSNDTPEGRSLNRRTEFRIIKN